jgi:RP/EB family microtubule-associated protein
MSFTQKPPTALKSDYTRTPILEWINTTLDLQLTRIEELGSGSVYCQLLDAAYPETVPMHKVKWNAKI